MNIAIIGDGTGADNKIKALAWEVGHSLAKNGCVVYTGGCGGYPFAAVEGALHVGGPVVAISPARDLTEHLNYYKFPTADKIEIQCTGLGIPGRNIQLINSVDGVIVIGGRIGTLNEFTLAFHHQKYIGVLMKTGGVIDLLPHIILACDRGRDKSRMAFFENPNELVRGLLGLMRR